MAKRVIQTAHYIFMLFQKDEHILHSFLSIDFLVAFKAGQKLCKTKYDVTVTWSNHVDEKIKSKVTLHP